MTIGSGGSSVVGEIPPILASFVFSFQFICFVALYVYIYFLELLFWKKEKRKKERKFVLVSFQYRTGNGYVQLCCVCLMIDY